jgi:hypothetical protein
LERLEGVKSQCYTTGNTVQVPEMESDRKQHSHAILGTKYKVQRVLSVKAQDNGVKSYLYVNQSNAKIQVLYATAFTVLWTTKKLLDPRLFLSAMPTTICQVMRQLDVKLIHTGNLLMGIYLVAILTVRCQTLQTVTSHYLLI